MGERITGTSHHENKFFSGDVLNFLTSEQFRNLVLAGKISLGLARPKLHDPEGRDKPQKEIFQDVLKDIQPPLEVALSFPLRFDSQAVHEMWPGRSQVSQKQKSPIFKSIGNRWDEFVEFMTSAESQVLILVSPSGSAIALWREQIGNNWRVSELREQVSAGLTGKRVPLRARYSSQDPAEALLNNSFHGSQTRDEVLTETQVIVNLLKRWVDEAGDKSANV